MGNTCTKDASRQNKLLSLFFYNKNMFPVLCYFMYFFAKKYACIPIALSLGGRQYDLRDHVENSDRYLRCTGLQVCNDQTLLLLRVLRTRSESQIKANLMSSLRRDITGIKPGWTAGGGNSITSAV